MPKITKAIITPAILEKTASGAGNEIQLTDALKTLAVKDKMLKVVGMMLVISQAF